MSIVVDIGNSRIKVAQFKDQELLNVLFLKEDEVLSSLEKLHFKNGIISNVGNKKLCQKILRTFPDFVLMSHNLNFPVVLKYNSVLSLGHDRIANAVGAHASFPNKNNLVIDVGTCITYDFLNNSNEYLGGGISPGFNLRMKALNSFTENLPVVNFKIKSIPLIGTNTIESIESGVVNGTINEIIQNISAYEQLHPEINVILTGGDTTFIKSIVSTKKNSIFADENLTLKGLYAVLKHNA
ncbi:MAG: type III pantothenate kinase [Flavobacteriales bacterium]|jgi:type III pantothenate kinase|tara:strand:+ start:577 stop:1296 length:720 start_codon:yes stop_codon:yes gene_type:complete